MKRLIVVLLVAVWPLIELGCARSNTAPLPTESNLTAGMAKKTIVKGSTTQAEVMEIFGPPDLLTHKDDMQIWTYDKIRYDIESSGNYFNVLIYGRNSDRARSSSTSTMLIIYFDDNDIVQDYRMNVTRF
ncbi:MAG: hypothetical protein JXN61_17830 [Sedimentisphaerales bacterium]|nr:hypothetical protein [Sedimentisphaerales bacterium]